MNFLCVIIVGFSLLSILAVLYAREGFLHPWRLILRILITGVGLLGGLTYLIESGDITGSVLCLGIFGALAYFTLRGLAFTGGLILLSNGGCAGLVGGFLGCALLGFIVCPFLWIHAILVSLRNALVTLVR